MAKITVNKRAALTDIVNDIQSGSISCFDDARDSAIIRQALYANRLNNMGECAYIEVKFVSKYSARERRIEIVSKADHKITLYKFSKSNCFDRDAIDLNRLLKEVEETFSATRFTFVGKLIFTQVVDLNSINEVLDDLNANDISLDYY